MGSDVYRVPRILEQHRHQPLAFASVVGSSFSNSISRPSTEARSVASLGALPAFTTAPAEARASALKANARAPARSAWGARATRHERAMAVEIIDVADFILGGRLQRVIPK